MITTRPAPAPAPAEQTTRCDRCKCTAHRDGKCPNRWCGCLKNRETKS